jgi:pSer/pThr/pTyr-binding forkhead associated (FHA) protein
MPKLLLKFEDSLLKEVPVGSNEVSIGRSPDNGLVIDNPAVSHYHARVFHEEGRLMLEDFGSLNGTFVNGQRVKMVALKPGDSVMVGKHSIVVSESREPNGSATGNGDARPAAPKINETVMLDTKARRDFLQQIAAVGESSDRETPGLVCAEGRRADQPRRGQFLLYWRCRQSAECQWQVRRATNQAFPGRHHRRGGH